jgi:hypothetical protein
MLIWKREKAGKRKADLFSRRLSRSNNEMFMGFWFSLHSSPSLLFLASPLSQKAKQAPEEDEGWRRA